MDLFVLLLGGLLSGLIGVVIGRLRGRELAGFLFGFFLGPIGWLIVALGPNYKAPAPSQAGDVDALAKLAELKAKGVLTEDEFQAKKKQLLGTPAS